MGLIPRSVVVVASLAPVLPTVVGLHRFRSLGSGGRLLLWWLGLSLALNVTMMILAMGNTRNHSVAHFSLPVFCALGMLTFGELTGERRYRWAVHSAIVIYAMVWLVLTGAGGAKADYSLYAHPLMNLLLTTAAAGLVVVRLVEVHDRVFHDTAILVGFGALVMFAPTVAIDPVAAMVAESNRELAINLYRSRAVFLILGFLLYTLALIWSPKHPSSFGF